MNGFNVRAYNAVAKRIMEAHGIQINDLYALALPRLGEIQRPANVHYTDPGSEVLAGGVAASIRAAHVQSVRTLEPKHESVLVVDAHGMMPSQVPDERVQTIPGGTRRSSSFVTASIWSSVAMTA